AENGRDAIRMFEEWQPHLIWMDMRMPDINGYEATTKIRQLKDGDKVKIIALTASVFKEQHQYIIEVGCDAVLHKPFHVSEIFAALVKHLGVEFIYEETEIIASSPTTEITAEMLAVLPSELRQCLQEATLSLDMEEIESVIEQTWVISPEIAEGLDELAKGFQFEQIIQLVEASGETTILKENFDNN
ncbi:MAG: response regulator, partial [Methylococcales bacterium]|nr:response regulator [Methylococcales bacterium]